jgi:hypothetical protein
MRILKNTAKSAKKKGSGTTLSLEAWVPRVVRGDKRDAIVSRIGSHYVVTTTEKYTSKEQRFSSLNTHFKECINVLLSIILNDAGGKQGV